MGVSTLRIGTERPRRNRCLVERTSCVCSAALQLLPLWLVAASVFAPPFMGCVTSAATISPSDVRVEEVPVGPDLSRTVFFSRPVRVSLQTELTLASYQYIPEAFVSVRCPYSHVRDSGGDSAPLLMEWTVSLMEPSDCDSACGRECGVCIQGIDLHVSQPAQEGLSCNITFDAALFHNSSINSSLSITAETSPAFTPVLTPCCRSSTPGATEAVAAALFPFVPLVQERAATTLSSVAHVSWPAEGNMCAAVSDSALGGTYTSLWLANGSGTGSNLYGSAVGPVFAPPNRLWGQLLGLSTGGFHACILLSADGLPSARCWGISTSDQTSVPFDSGDHMVGVACGGYHTCFLHSSGSMDCVGYNHNKQTDVPQLAVGTTWASVSTGAAFTCAITNYRALICFGSDLHGQVSDVPLHHGQWRSVSCGDGFACGLTAGGDVVCWGKNNTGQLVVPPRPPGTEWLMVSAGFEHACGLLLPSRAAVCWGNTVAFPASILAMGPLLHISAGRDVTCGVSDRGVCQCAGLNHYNVHKVPQISEGLRWIQIEASSFRWLVCGTTENAARDRELHCWGDTYRGSNLHVVPQRSPRYVAVASSSRIWCGLLETGDLRCDGAILWDADDLPSLPLGVHWTSSLSVGYFHACGVLSDGSGLCFGRKTEGQCNLPTLANGTKFVKLIARGLFTVGLLSNGSLVCVGDSSQGQCLHDATQTYIDISAGYSHTCALLASGGVYCAGVGYGGSSFPSWLHLNASSLGISYSYTVYAILVNGSLVCTGYPCFPIPQVNEGWLTVVHGSWHVCGQTVSGRIFCWSRLGHRQLEFLNVLYDPFFAIADGNLVWIASESDLNYGRIPGDSTGLGRASMSPTVVDANGFISITPQARNRSLACGNAQRQQPACIFIDIAYERFGPRTYWIRDGVNPIETTISILRTGPSGAVFRRHPGHMNAIVQCPRRLPCFHVQSGGQLTLLVLEGLIFELDELAYAVRATGEGAVVVIRNCTFRPLHTEISVQSVVSINTFAQLEVHSSTFQSFTAAGAIISVEYGSTLLRSTTFDATRGWPLELSTSLAIVDGMLVNDCNQAVRLQSGSIVFGRDLILVQTSPSEQPTNAAFALDSSTALWSKTTCTGSTPLVTSQNSTVAFVDATFLDVGAMTIQRSDVWLYSCNIQHASHPPLSTDGKSRNGGAISMERSSLSFEVSAISGAHADVGGAIYLWNSQAWLKNSSFHRNSASIGGAVFVGGSSALGMGDCIFESNVAVLDGGAVCADASSQVTLSQQVSFRNNSALLGGGGAVYAENTGPGVWSREMSFQSNTAPYGPNMTSGPHHLALSGLGRGSEIFLREDLEPSYVCQLVDAQDHLVLVLPGYALQPLGRNLDVEIRMQLPSSLMANASLFGQTSQLLRQSAVAFPHIQYGGMPHSNVSFTFSCTIPLILNVDELTLAASSGAVNVTGCRAGDRYDALRGACLPCAEGSRSDGVTSEACVPCSPGTTSLPRSSSCVPCPPGSEAAATGSSGCNVCRVGSFTNVSGMSSCALCPPGRFSDTTNQTVCTLCTRGSFSASPGALSCLLCTQGRFNAQEGGTQCLTCDPGTFQNRSGSSFCSSCAPGHAEPGTGSVDCPVCSPGRYSSRSNQTICESCSAGYYQRRDRATACDACSSGHLSTLDGSSACTQCAAGTFQSAINSSSCVLCEPGRFQNSSGSSYCNACPRGRAAASAGSAVCLACTQGRYAIDEGQSSCLVCSKGRYQGLEGSSKCRDCAVGRFSSFIGSTACLDCAIGSVQMQVNASTCSPCEPGRFMNETGASSCYGCPKGHASVGSGTTECVHCGVGRFARGSSSASCAPCPTGRFQHAIGSCDCEPCPVGFAASTEGSSVCLACAQGTFSNSTGQTDCYDCEVGKYQHRFNASSCVVCPDGLFTTSAGSRFCQSCGSGFYSVRAADGYHRGCDPCPVGLQCVNGDVRVLPNYWVERAADGTMRLIQCPPKYCEGSSSNEAGPMCARGRLNPPSINPLCGQCEAGMSEWNGVCQACTETNWSGLFLVVLASTGFVIFLLYSSTKPATGVNKIFFFFVQMALLLLSDNTVYLRSLYAALSLNILSVSAGSSCIFPVTQMERALLGYASMPLLSCELALVAAVHFCVSRGRRSSVERVRVSSRVSFTNKDEDVREDLQGCRKLSPWAHFQTETYLRVGLNLYMLTFNSISLTSLEYLNCVDVGAGVSVVRSYPAIQCHTGEWSVYVPIVYMVTLIYLVIVPCCLLWRLVRASQLPNLRDAIKKVYGGLFEPFSSSSYYWGIAILFRRFAWVTLWVFLNGSPFRLMSVSLLNGASLVLHLLVRPFQNVNTQETLSLSALSVMTIVLQSLSDPISDETSWVFGTLVAAVALVILLPAMTCVTLRSTDNPEEVSTRENAGTRSRTSTLEFSALSQYPDCTPEPSDSRGNLPVAMESSPTVASELAGELTTPESIMMKRRQSVSAALPSGWSVHLNDDLVPYYHNEATGQTQWSKPGDTID